MDWEGNDTTPEQVPITQKQYDCGICGQTSPSTDENPIGLVILVQVSGRRNTLPDARNSFELSAFCCV